MSCLPYFLLITSIFFMLQEYHSWELFLTYLLFLLPVMAPSIPNGYGRPKKSEIIKNFIEPTTPTQFDEDHPLSRTL